MKNLILFFCILILGISSIVNAQQPYQSCFGKESTKWITVKPTSYWGMEKEYTLNYYTFDNIKYYGWYNGEQSEGLLYYETDNNSKLWRLEPLSGQKNIVMDLNWKVGDLIYIDTEVFKQKYEERPYAVVESVFQDEHNHKVILTDLVLDIDTTHFKLKFTEGVGPNASPFIFDSNGLFWGMSNLLLCTYKDDVLSYTNTEAGGECTYKKPVSSPIIQSKPEVIALFQSNIISLDFDDKFSGLLCLINLDGKVIKKENINKNNKSINIKEIPKGVYLIQITDRTGQYCTTQKILKN